MDNSRSADHVASLRAAAEFHCAQVQSASESEWKALGLSALLNIILFAVFLGLATPYYETNDDLSMQCIASGLYTGHPSEHLVFTNVLIGLALRSLYRLWQGPNWYFLYLITTHFAAMTAIGYVILRRRLGWLVVTLYGGFFLVAEARNLLMPQFTTTAFVCGPAGLFLMADGLSPDRRVGWSRALAGAGFVILAGLIREPVAPFLAIAASPFIIERFAIKGWRRLAAAGAICIAILFTLQQFNRWYYRRNPAWSDYFEYNRLNGQIHGTPLTRFIPQAAASIGWSENDARMFAWFYYADPEVYAGTVRMRAFLGKLRALARGADSWRFSPRYLLPTDIFWRETRILLRITLLAAAALLLVAAGRRRRLMAVMLASCGVFVFLNYYLLKSARMPQRVSYNLPFFLLAACLFWASELPGKAQERLGRDVTALGGRIPRPLLLAAATSIFCLYLYSGASLIYDLGQNLWNANRFQQHLKEVRNKIFEPVGRLLPPGQKPVLVTLPYDSMLEQCLFFVPSVNQLPCHVVPYGWLDHSPIFDEILDETRLRPYSLSQVDRPDVFYLMEPRWLQPLKTFYREHYGKNVNFNLVLNTDVMPDYNDCQLHLYQAHDNPTGVTPLSLPHP